MEWRNLASISIEVELEKSGMSDMKLATHYYNGWTGEDRIGEVESAKEGGRGGTIGRP